MKSRFSATPLVYGLLLLLAACSQPAPVNVDSQLWTGTSRLQNDNGITVDVYAGFKQTGNEVRAKLAFNRAGSTDIAVSPTLTGTISGSNIDVSRTDSSGTGAFRGTFDASRQNLTGVFTIPSPSGELVINVTLAYNQPLRDASPLNPLALRENRNSYGALRRALGK